MSTLKTVVEPQPASAASTCSADDIEITFYFLAAEDEWQVWTPDAMGACIGSGKTIEEAAATTAGALLRVAERLRHPPNVPVSDGANHK